MLPMHIALTSRSTQVTLSDLSEVAAALQKQIVRDVGPVWGINATVDAFTPDRVPAGYWSIVIQDELDDPDVAGYHQVEADNTPYALVAAGPTWSLTASHECVEMLIDPQGSRTLMAPSLNSGQGKVAYLLEVCDPCQDARFAYSVNGVMVSDFCTPRFFDPVAAPAIRYSFTGALARPLQVLPGGYISWINAGRAWQAHMGDDGELQLFDHGEITDRRARSLREHFDSLNPRSRGLSNAIYPDHIARARIDADQASSGGQAKVFGEIDRRFRRADCATSPANGEKHRADRQ